MGIVITYRCRCMPAEAEFEVRARRPDEDVVDWVEGVVGQALTADHARRSPDCMSTQTEYIKVPVPENAPSIGMEPRLDG